MQGFLKVELANIMFCRKSISSSTLLTCTSSYFSINLSTILAPVLNNHLMIKQTILTIAGINLRQHVLHHPINHLFN
jgi:hypothetical protein